MAANGSRSYSAVQNSTDLLQKMLSQLDRYLRLDRPASSHFAPPLLSPSATSSRRRISSVPSASYRGTARLTVLMAPSPAASSSSFKSKPKPKPTVNNSSLSSIVSQLVRSQYGATAAEVKDDQLDKHVAELLLKEAKDKEKAWGERAGGGGGGYLSSGGEDK